MCMNYLANVVGYHADICQCATSDSEELIIAFGYKCGSLT